MRSRLATLTALSGALLVIAIATAIIVIAKKRGEGDARCADGFAANGPRCLPVGCPAPLALGARGCNAPDVRVAIPATTLAIGPSDWEAEGRVAPRTLTVKAFAIDAFELTRGSVDPEVRDDLARAASGLSYDEAERACRVRGGRLPTEDEWIVAAAGARGSRYPWGDTGAVCRRAAWGLEAGPCASSGSGPDTVGAHQAGATPLGVHDLAGNVAEWVTVSSQDKADVAAVRGGSWRTALAADLRTWARRELPKSTHADDVGARCVYAIP